jgi:hypothetical protein
LWLCVAGDISGRLMASLASRRTHLPSTAGAGSGRCAPRAGELRSTTLWGSCPAARATVHSLSCILAGRVRLHLGTLAGSAEGPAPRSGREPRPAALFGCARDTLRVRKQGRDGPLAPPAGAGVRSGQVSWWSSRVAYEVPVGLREHPRRRSPKREAKRRGLQRVLRRPVLERAHQAFTTRGSILAPPIIHDKGITALKSARVLPSLL